jgi:sarcosine oxidase, subunit beta
MQTADVVVVGAGVNGLSTAFHLAKVGVNLLALLRR